MTMLRIFGLFFGLLLGVALGKLDLDFDGSAELFDYRAEGSNRKADALYVHFHGAAEVVSDRFVRAKMQGVLLVVNCKGLSAAYAKPFRERPTLFAEMLDEAGQEAGLLSSDDWKHIAVSSFSAGYGAVREVLKKPTYRTRIDALLALDSMYASLEATEDGARLPLKAHMRDYQTYAKLAAQNKKTFIITHSNQSTSYASTTETADALLASLGMKRLAVPDLDRNDANRLMSTASSGGFTVLGYAGIEGKDHLWHLRQMGRWWPRVGASNGGAP